MTKPQFHIKCPRTNKNLTVSRDVYYALEYAQQTQKQKQSEVGSQLKQSGEALSNKYYTGETKDMSIAVKFNERGQVNEFADPRIEFKAELDKLPPEAKKAAESAIQQFMICINQALDTKSTDMEKELKAKLQPAA